jgi:microcompartment protein CcmL/EutN
LFNQLDLIIYVAWKSSQYLNRLISENHLIPEPSTSLDSIYSISNPPEQVNTNEKSELQSQKKSDEEEEEEMKEVLLTRDRIKLIVNELNLGEDAGIQLLRARDQAEGRLMEFDKAEVEKAKTS